MDELVLAERALVDELTPCDDPAAAVRNARSMLGMYPGARAADEEQYIRGIAGALAMFPRRVQGEAINRVTLTCKWTPTRAEVYEACEAICSRLRVAHRMATMLMDEQRRRDEKHARTMLVESERRKFRAKYGDKSPLHVAREKAQAAQQENENGEPSPARSH